MTGLSILFLAVWAAPLVSALAVSRLRERSPRWAPLAGLPALGAALLVPAGSFADYPWLLAGSRFGLDQTGKLFLLFTAIVWIFAAWFATGYIARKRTSFYASFFLAMAGNFGLVLAADLLSFYLFFALMSFASYGLIIHDRTDAVRYAGKVYVVLVVIGEILVFAGMVGLASVSGGFHFSSMDPAWTQHPSAGLIAGCLLLGFGIKAGALPLHVWLPLAHPAAPAPASAVLSGAMIKAGLLGWLRFLPVGAAALPAWGEACFIGGLAATLYAVVIGLPQDRTKTILAYSSIGKMGLLTMAVGLALMRPGEATPIVAALGLFALHHAACKGALFLSTAIHPHALASPGKRAWALAGLFVPPLSLAGLAFSGGAIANTALKKSLGAYAGLVPAGIVSVLLFLGALGTAGLMIRFLWIHLRQAPAHAAGPGRAAWWAWSLLTILLAAAPALFYSFGYEKAVAKALTAQAALQAMGTLLAAAALGWLALRFVRPPVSAPPEGDLLHLYVRFLRAGGSVIRAVAGLGRVFLRAGEIIRTARRAASLSMELVCNVERTLGKAGLFGFLFLALLAGFVGILIGASPS